MFQGLLAASLLFAPHPLPQGGTTSTPLGARNRIAGSPTFCAPSLDDVSGPGQCLNASSVPLLGALYPLSPELYVEASSGWIGLGTTLPAARLDVLGDVHTEGDIRLDDDVDGIRFSSEDGDPSGGNAPMISMFSSGSANPDRMVIAHSPAFPLWGLEYEDAGDRFVFQNDGTPVMTVDLGGTNVTVNNGSELVSEDNLIVNGVASFTDRSFFNEFVSIVNNDPNFPTLENTSGNAAQFATTVIGRSVEPNFGNINLLIQAPSATGFSNYNHIEARNLTTFDAKFRVDAFGTVFADGAHTGPADFAEMIRVTTGADTVEPGDLLVIDPLAPRGVRIADSPRSRLVAGVYSTNPGFVGSERDWDVLEAVHEPEPGRPGPPRADLRYLDRGDMAALFDEVPLAVVGIVPVKATAENGPIRPGDLLVSSFTPGHVMRDDDPSIGTVVGKALDALAAGEARIRVLVTLQ